MSFEEDVKQKIESINQKLFARSQKITDMDKVDAFQTLDIKKL
jgi:uncharacterized protein YfkK (UPF0435 family)